MFSPTMLSISYMDKLSQIVTSSECLSQQTIKGPFHANLKTTT